MVDISILILTLNEEPNIHECLESVKWSNDIVVFDSFSTDETLKIAKTFGARTFQRKFDNFASQRNAALHNVNYKNEWVLMVDADERISKNLVNEISEIIKNVNSEIVLFRIKRKDHLYGKWLKRSNNYPTWFGRLVRPNKVYVNRIVNEEYLTNGKIGYLKEHIIHHSYNAGFSAWIETQNRHSSMEAKIKDSSSNGEQFNIKDLFSKDPINRRKASKQIALRLPFRPLIVFIYWYIIRLGFIEGKAGFNHCMLRAFYEYMLNLKVFELKRRKEGLPI